MADEPILRGIIDTSVVIDLEHVAAGELPAELAVSAITLAELTLDPRSARGFDRDDIDQAFGAAEVVGIARV